MNEKTYFKINFKNKKIRRRNNSLSRRKTSVHTIFKPKRTIILTLMETSQKSFKENKKCKRKLKRKQTSANSILFFRLWAIQNVAFYSF